MFETSLSSVQPTNVLPELIRKRKSTDPDHSGSNILDEDPKSIRVNPDELNKGLQLDEYPHYRPDASNIILGRDCDGIIMSKPGDLDDENFERSLVDKKSPENSVNHYDRPLEIGNDASNKPVNMPSKVIERLWDGSLQLSATIAVSAVAFFKSGEKASKIKWPKTVEVKGKVRLDAFEKFIQELPRSRNRTLMVISVCWNVHSSKTGLFAMKEAAKNYKEGKRVGLAEISPGVVLYVCPRSDSIITILAKYGFFKGKAVLEGDQDSFIGCVVWRRNRTSSVLSKNSEKKVLSQVGQSVEPPSGAVVVKPEVLHGCQISPPSVNEATLQISKINENMKNPSNVDELLCNTVPMPAALALDNSQISSGELPSSTRPGLISLQSAREFVTELAASEVEEASTIVVSADPLPLGVSQHGLGSEKRYAASTYDDDLPEFDFSTACGDLLLRPASKLGLLNDKDHFSKRRRDEGDSVPLLPTAKVMGINNQRVSRPSAFQLPAINPTADSRISQKNIWDDDDNIPEWIPPELKHKAMLSSVSTIGPHMPSPLAALTTQRAPPWPLMPRNFTAQVLPPYLPSMQMRPVAGSVMQNLTYAPGFGNPDQVLRPQFGMFDRGPQINWRGWRS
ncbi:uncharacterized protein [Aristolochia californica]|uniref:uncharacterized protein n=1 Tax=Aristolochia californica TaxID=171875 RepID=UPI0035E120B7